VAALFPSILADDNARGLEILACCVARDGASYVAAHPQHLNSPKLILALNFAELHVLMIFEFGRIQAKRTEICTVIAQGKPP
jgi:hypothetical protein